MSEPGIVGPWENRGIKHIRAEYAKKLIAKIDTEPNSGLAVIKLGNRYYEVTDAKAEDVLMFYKEKQRNRLKRADMPGARGWA